MLTNSKQISGSNSERNCNLRGINNCNTSNVIDQLSCEACPEDFIGKTITPLRIITINHRFHLFHWNSERPVSQHAIAHKNKSWKLLSPTRIAPFKFRCEATQTKKYRSGSSTHTKSRQSYGLNMNIQWLLQ